MVGRAAGALWMAILVGGLNGAESAVELDGRSVATWTAQLRSESRGLQMRAARALAGVAGSARAAIVPEVVPLLKSERENDKFVAAQVLGEYGPVARAAVADLLPLLEGTQHERNRAAAAKALGQILQDAKPDAEVGKAVDALIAVFGDRYSDVRREAATACGMIGPAAKACIPHLTRLFDDRRVHGRPQGGPSGHEMFMVISSAVWTAGRMGPLAAEHIDRLIAMLQSEREIATTVVWAIGEIGPLHENVVPNLLDRLEKAIYGQYGGFRVGAQGYRIGVITEGTKQEYHDFCFASLAKFGVKAKAAEDLMIRIVKHGADNNRIRDVIGALRVLRALGPAAKAALPVLEQTVAIERFDSRTPCPVHELFKEEAAAALAAVKGEQ